MTYSSQQLSLFDPKKDFRSPSNEIVRSIEKMAISIARDHGLKVRHIRWKNNRRVMASVSKNGDLNLHMIYRLATKVDLKALAGVMSGKGGKREKELFNRFITTHLPNEDTECNSRLTIIPPRGLFHDLNRALKIVLPLLDEPLKSPPQVGWSPVRVGRKGITWGTHRETKNGPLILINALLDSHDVPGFVVEHILWHELCHQIAPPENGSNGRRRVHSNSFRSTEERYPRLKQAENWEQENVVRLIRKHLKRRR
ncbi:MAG: hypothetical protein ABIC40_06835 [bacterium]